MSATATSEARKPSMDILADLGKVLPPLTKAQAELLALRQAERRAAAIESYIAGDLAFHFCGAVRLARNVLNYVSVRGGILRKHEYELTKRECRHGKCVEPGKLDYHWKHVQSTLSAVAEVSSSVRISCRGYQGGPADHFVLPVLGPSMEELQRERVLRAQEKIERRRVAKQAKEDFLPVPPPYREEGNQPKHFDTPKQYSTHRERATVLPDRYRAIFPEILKILSEAFPGQVKRDVLVRALRTLSLDPGEVLDLLPLGVAEALRVNPKNGTGYSLRVLSQPEMAARLRRRASREDALQAFPPQESSETTSGEGRVRARAEELIAETIQARHPQFIAEEARRVGSFLLERGFAPSWDAFMLLLRAAETKVEKRRNGSGPWGGLKNPEAYLRHLLLEEKREAFFSDSLSWSKYFEILDRIPGLPESIRNAYWSWATAPKDKLEALQGLAVAAESILTPSQGTEVKTRIESRFRAAGYPSGQRSGHWSEAWVCEICREVGLTEIAEFQIPPFDPAEQERREQEILKRLREFEESVGWRPNDLAEDPAKDDENAISPPEEEEVPSLPEEDQEGLRIQCDRMVQARNAYLRDARKRQGRATGESRRLEAEWDKAQCELRAQLAKLGSFRVGGLTIIPGQPNAIGHLERLFFQMG